VTDIIQEIKILEQSAEKKLVLTRAEQANILALAKRHSMEDISRSQSAAAQVREQVLRKKEQQIEQEKRAALERVQDEAVRIHQDAEAHTEEAIGFLVKKAITK
jgi:vacuolar-type H+-ATPase subunit H